jgi:SP family sugar:H+ symporter-like MFS transporter
MFWMEVPPSAAFLIGVLLIPESPRFLVRVGRREEALAVFARVGSKDADALVTQVEKSVAGEHRPRLADVMKPGTRNLASIVWVGIGLAAFQQFVGINVIFYYGSVLWDAVGISEQNALLLNLLSGFINIVATILAMALIDRVGRKPLLLAGSIGMIATLACVAVAFSTAHPDARGQPVLAHGVALAGLVAVNLYIIAFGVSWGPVMWVLLGEMFPTRMRGTGLAIAGATNWVANFVVTVTFLPLMNAAGLAGAYSAYLVAALLSLFFVWRYVRETKGKALEEM